MEYRFFWPYETSMIIVFAQIGLAVILEWIVRHIRPRIRSPKCRNVFGWSMFAVIRLVLCDSLNCMMERSTRHSLIFANFVNESVVDAAICDAIYLFGYIALGLILWTNFRAALETVKRCLDWQEKRQWRDRQQISIWLRGKRLQFEHCHLSIDLISLVYEQIYRHINYNRTMPCNVKFYTVTMLDSDIADDPISPEVSLVRSVMVFVCDECTKDNGAYLIETSLLRRESRFTKMRQLDNNLSPEEFDQMQFSVFQSAGVVITHVTGGQYGPETWFYNLRLKEEALVKKWPSGIFLDSDKVCYFVHDKNRAQNPAAMRFFAGFLREDSTPAVSFSFRHCVFEISNLSETVRVGGMPEIHFCFSQPWRLGNFRYFQSPGRVGVVVDMINAFDESSIRCIAFEPANNRLSTALYQDYLRMDEPFRCYELYWLERGEADIPCPEIFGATEAMSVQDDGSISRVKIKAASLKWSCLEKIFDVFEDDVKGVSAQKKWLQIIGVPLDGHYSDS